MLGASFQLAMVEPSSSSRATHSIAAQPNAICIGSRSRGSSSLAEIEVLRHPALERERGARSYLGEASPRFESTIRRLRVCGQEERRSADTRKSLEVALFARGRLKIATSV
jgi:hypothetical protein